MSFELGDYNDVPHRIAEFREKHPDGSLQPVDPLHPYEVLAIGGATFIVYSAAAYRAPDDERPGIGVAFEPFPGKTQFTRDSELQNAETSAWGRAIVAVLAADTKKGIATAEEVRNRREDSAVDVDQRPSLAATIASLPDGQRKWVRDNWPKYLATKPKDWKREDIATIERLLVYCEETAALAGAREQDASGTPVPGEDAETEAVTSSVSALPLGGET